MRLTRCPCGQEYGPALGVTPLVAHAVRVLPARPWSHCPCPCLCRLQAKIGIKMHDPSNIIFMKMQLEKAFDKWHWTVLPEGPDVFKVTGKWHMSLLGVV